MTQQHTQHITLGSRPANDRSMPRRELLAAPWSRPRPGHVRGSEVGASVWAFEARAAPKHYPCQALRLRLCRHRLLGEEVRDQQRARRFVQRWHCDGPIRAVRWFREALHLRRRSQLENEQRSWFALPCASGSSHGCPGRETCRVVQPGELVHVQQGTCLLS